jgi:hypothetical protein
MGVEGILGIEVWYQPYADACSSLVHLIHACSHTSTILTLQMSSSTSCIWSPPSVPIHFMKFSRHRS